MNICYSKDRGFVTQFQLILSKSAVTTIQEAYPVTFADGGYDLAPGLDVNALFENGELEF